MLKGLLVFAGAGLGGLLRFGVGELIYRFAGRSFPWGTFFINVSGCFLMGILMYLFETRQLLTPNMRLFAAVGILGGYTTFSSFGYDWDLMQRNGQLLRGMAYVAGSVVLGLGAVWAGRAVTRVLGG